MLPLPERTPAGFSYEAFEKLGPSWETWSEETLKLTEALYEEAFSQSAQQQVLADLRLKQQTVIKALGDPVYAPIHPQLSDLYGKLTRRLDVYDGLAALLSGAPEGAVLPKTAADSGLTELRAAYSDLESSLLVIPQGPTWLPFIAADELAAATADGDLSDADREILQKVLGRLNDVDSLQAEQKEFLQQPMFRKLATAIETALAGPAAAGDENVDPDSPLQQAAADLLLAIEEYESSGSREAANDIRNLLQGLQAAGGPAAGPLVSAMRAHYFNFNLKVVASEAFLKNFFNQQRSESGAVRDQFEDVEVSGCQWTTTDVSVDLKHNDSSAQFMLTLDGKIRTSTIGEVCPATVYTAGNACFRAEKDIYFDGTSFTLDPARIGVNANNCSYDAKTCVEFIPIARGLARNFVLQQAADKKSESDAHARSRISKQVRSKFNEETARQFSELEGNLESKLYGPLGELNVRPESIAMNTTETELYLRERLMGTGELGAGRPPIAPLPLSGAAVQVHQSLLSNGADRFGFAGQRLTAKEMNERIAERLDRVFPNRKKPAEDPDAKQPDDTNRLIFDEVDPISFQFEDGQLIMSLRAGLERPGEEEIPTQIISVPLKLTLEGGELVIERGTVGVKPVDRPDNIGEQIARANIMRGRIEEGIPPRQSKSAQFDVDAKGKIVALNVTSIVVEDGWLTILAE
ncbi:MAG: hypothetical protein R3B90_11650 [Planctomycetaceae bacterium]